MTALPPGATIGILGGGQLGRMLAVAAAGIGYRCHIYAPEDPSPAAEVAAAFTCAGYDDAAALDRFADAVDVVTYEFENVPTAAVARLAARKPIRPGLKPLETAQDRLSEKQFVAGLGGRPAPYAPVDTLDDLHAALDRIGSPAILKTRRFGYDGKGQARIAKPADADAAWQSIGGRPAVLEGFVRFDQEFSVILVRAPDGACRSWTVPENTHEGGVLARSVVPAAGLAATQAGEAAAFAEKVAAALDYVGVLTLEFFATADGPLFNEMAPRVHNSGHWTIEGAVTSQFENHIRAVVGLPLGDTSLAARAIEMTNLIGADADRWPALFADPAAHVHLYGKGEARPGRKMGHVTRLML
jgi:5-(carboxyamino)imidazole ribonucleotide synthase